MTSETSQQDTGLQPASRPDHRLAANCSPFSGLTRRNGLTRICLSVPIGLLIAVLWCTVGCEQSAPEAPQASTIASGTPWPKITQQAEGTRVRMAMWDGDPLINSYMRDFVGSRLQAAGVTLECVGLRGPQLVQRLQADLQAGRTRGDLDLVWINGETFYQLRRADALYGPINELIPNTQWLDLRDPFIARDFQQPIEGWECPWGSVQMTLIYDPENVSQPPETLDQLSAWIRSHPGRFTVDNSFTGMSFLKSLLIHFAGGGTALDGPFDEARYQAAAGQLWAWLSSLQPFLWREGRTFPEDVAQLHQLLNSGEVDFSMSLNDGEVDNKVLQGILPKSCRGYVPRFGTIRNTHYLGIPRNAPNPAGALVVINFLISPEAQLEKAKPAVWGDGTVLATERLPGDWPARFSSVAGRDRVPPRSELRQRALAEPAPEIMIRLHEDFRREIIERGH